MNSDINFFAETTFRNQRKRFGIKIDDRRRHMYLIGKTGMGKTAALKNMAIQDIREGRGLGFVDPHGEAAEDLLNFVPSSRVNDVIYFNPADIGFPIAFNIMESVSAEYRHLVASGLMGVFKKIWPDVWSARMEYILNNSILALLEYPGATLLGVNRMLADPEYRKKVVDKVTDPMVKSFWMQEFARYTQRYEVEATAAIQNKVGQFISAPLIRNIIGQVKSTIDMRNLMDERKILIANISKGRMGEDNSRLLGALLITRLQLAAMSRVDIPEEERQDFFLYVDEFQNFATESFTNILSEARKYRLALILGHQYITQMEETVRDAVFGNVGTLVTFRVGAADAEFLEREFTPDFLASDLVNLTKYNIYLKLLIDGIAGSAFSAYTLPPLPKTEESNVEKIIKVSRERYGTPRATVEDKIARWSGVSDIKEALPVQQASQPVLYDAQCAACKKWTKVIFAPDGTRPVYCKTCLKKTGKERRAVEGESKESNSETRTQPRIEPKAEVQGHAQIQNQNQARNRSQTISLKEAVEKPPTFFYPPRKEKNETERPKRKEVNLSELKQVLKDSLEGNNRENSNEGK